MKTTTYLRFSLLIPFLVWGVSILLFMLWGELDPSSLGDGSDLRLYIFISLAFYVFGIIGWFLPYLILAFILLIWSFKSRADVLMRGFALSPLVMAVFTVLFVLTLFRGDDIGSASPEFVTNPGEFIGSNIFFAVLALFWGYLNVAIGYGIYKLLQRGQIIRDEMLLSPPKEA